LADTHTKSYAAGPRGGSDANGRLTAYTRRAERLAMAGRSGRTPLGWPVVRARAGPGP
jgi:hypothetical protein